MTPRQATDRLLQALGLDPELEPWLARLARPALAAAPDSFAHAVGAGLLGRLWSPGRPRDKRAARLVDWLLGLHPPSRAARAWFAGLPPEQRAALVEEARRRARELAGSLADLGSARIRAKSQRARALCAWLHRRDDLECIAFLLGGHRAAAPLSRELRRLDRAAAAALSLNAGALPGDARLRAVAWQEPEQWWGRMALR